MLHQMVTDEKEAAVREAAIRSMAVVLVHCDDDDKFSQVSTEETVLLIGHHFTRIC